MPPPKLKLYKTGKPKALSKPTLSTVPQTTDGSLPNTSSELDSENVRQLELELAWCIQTMESSLNGGKLNASQGIYFYFSTRHHKNSQNIEEFEPIINKEAATYAFIFRRLSRKNGRRRKEVSLFCIQIEGKLMNFISVRRQIQFSNQTNSKSFFVKRSVLSTIGKDKEFKFDFPATTEQLIENLNLNDTKNDESKSRQHTNGIPYASTTDNSFRFNFDITEET